MILTRLQRNQFAEDLDNAIKFNGILAEFQWLRPILRLIPHPQLQDLFKLDDRVQTYGHVAVENAKEGQLSKANVFSRILDQGGKSDGSGLTDYQVAFEASGLIVAGSGTTAVTLTYLVWAVLSNPEIQSRLEHEVNGLENGYRDAILETLPYLNAVIDETLRLFGAAPGSLPRQAPKGGAQLGDYFAPEGTTISSQAYTLHRNESLYPQSER